jgi:hypothetical protein
LLFILVCLDLSTDNNLNDRNLFCGSATDNLKIPPAIPRRVFCLFLNPMVRFATICSYTPATTCSQTAKHSATQVRNITTIAQNAAGFFARTINEDESEWRILPVRKPIATT